MISAKIFKKNGQTYKIIVSGHSGYAEEGSDIVCASISTLAQTVCVGLENVLKLKPITKISDGYLECQLTDDIINNNNQNVQIIFDTFESTINLLLESDKTLNKYVNLEVKNEIY